MAAAARRVRADASAGDRLSALPDDLLHRVLSFLPSQQVVQTSVLSKRWTSLWRSAPCIDINIRTVPRTAADSYYGELKANWEKMEDFTTNLLMLHDAPTLDAFRFEIDFIDHNRLQVVNRWARRGIMYRPSALEIVVRSGPGVPHELRVPHLGGSSSSRLKRLHLCGVSLDGSFADQLSSGCPVLEDLELYKCDNKFREIQSSTLKNLVILGSERSVDMLVIRAPALASLRLGIPYYIYGSGVSLDGSMNSLVKASISVYSNYLPPGCITPRCRVALLGSLSSVTNLELTGFSATVMLDKELDKFPIFKNLRTLSLASCLLDQSDVDCKFKALGRFLQKAPNLEKLTLQHCWDLDGSKRKDRKRKTRELPLYSPDQKAFGCQNLKLVEIKYEGHKNDDDHQMFQIMWGLWRNLQKATLILTKI